MAEAWGHFIYLAYILIQERTAPAKAAVSALVNLDNLKISAKEAQAAAAAAAAVSTFL